MNGADWIQVLTLVVVVAILTIKIAEHIERRGR